VQRCCYLYTHPQSGEGLRGFANKKGAVCWRSRQCRQQRMPASVLVLSASSGNGKSAQPDSPAPGSENRFFVGPQEEKTPPKSGAWRDGTDQAVTACNLPVSSKTRRTVAPASLGCTPWRSAYGSSAWTTRSADDEQPTAMKVSIRSASSSSRSSP